MPESTDTRTVFRACTLCEACCGLAVTVRDNTVLEIRGDPDDPMSRGYLCPKGVANVDILTDPDRLRRPRVRAGAEWRDVGWGEALDEAAAGLAEVVRRHGPDAVALYIGNAAVHGAGALLMVNELMCALGTRRRYTASSLDQQPQQLLSFLLYGNPVLLPVPDVDRTDHMLILGGNPAVSNGSLMTAPDMRRRLRAIRDRGGRVVVVDPRRTETSALADEHVFIRPGTDVFLLLGMLHTVVAEGRVDPGLFPGGAAGSYVDGVAEVCRIVSEFPPVRVARTTGIPATTIVRLAQEFATAPSAVAYGRLGVCQTEFGTTAYWLLHCLNILTGNLDRPGGMMFPTPAIDIATIIARYTRLVGYDRFRSRVGDIPEVAGDLPAATMAEEMLTPGAGRIRALVTVGGNPVLSVPGGKRMDSALASLDFMVAVDPYVTESSRHADVVLPPRVAFERDEVEAVFGALSVHNFARYSPRAVDPDPDTRDDAQILAGVVSRLARRAGSPVSRSRGFAVSTVVGRGGLDGLLDLAIRTGPYGGAVRGLTLSKVKAARHGLDLGPLVPSLPGRLFTSGKRIRLDHPVLVADIERVVAALDDAGQADAGYDLLLIGRRHLRSNNSWLANSPRLVRGRDRCTVLLHPADAAARGVGKAQTVRLTSHVGSIDLPAEISDEIMPGVVAVPHGWGHGRPGVGWRTAAAHPGASVNDITDPTVMDPLSGNASLQGVPVRLAPVTERSAGLRGDADAVAGRLADAKPALP